MLATITIEGGLVTVITTLGVAVAALWRVVLVNNKRTMTKLDECERDRRKLWERIGGE